MLHEATSSYAFEVKWIPGKNNVIADTFSRYPSSAAPPLTVASMVLGNASIVNRLKSAAASCPIYRQIRDAFIANKDPHRLPDNHPARQLLTVWDNLSDAGDGLLCVDAKQLFVPRSCRPDTLEILHASHPASRGCTALHATIIIGLALKTMCPLSSTSVTLASTSRPASNPMCKSLWWPRPPWSLLHGDLEDLFQIGNAHYLILVDHFSGFPLVSRLSSLSSKAVIECLTSWFLLFRCPRTIQTDGGPQFWAEFCDFCSLHSIVHKLASPYQSLQPKASSTPPTLSSGRTTSALMMGPWPSRTNVSSGWLTIDHFCCLLFVLFVLHFFMCSCCPCCTLGRCGCHLQHHDPSRSLLASGGGSQCCHAAAWMNRFIWVHTLRPDFRFCGIQAQAPSRNTRVLLFIFRGRRGPKLHSPDSFITTPNLKASSDNASEIVKLLSGKDG